MGTIKIYRGQAPHAAVAILLWVFFAIAMQSLTTMELLITGIPLLVAAYALSDKRMRALFHRTRWIMLSLFLIFAYATPGAAVWPALDQFSPTYEGVIDGLVQLNRLVFALAGLAILLSLLSQQQLVSGLYALGYPLRYIGISRARAAVRLALTLHYAESAIQKSASNWREILEQMISQEDVKKHSIELQVTPLNLRDGLLIILGCVLLLLVLC